MTSNDDYVLQLLLEQSIVTAEQAMMATGTGGVSVLDELVKKRIVSEDDILGLLASQFGMDVVDIDASQLDTELAKVITDEDSRKYGVVPLMRNGDTLIVAVQDPLNYNSLDSLRYLLKCNVEGVVATRADIARAMKVLYPDKIADIKARPTDRQNKYITIQIKDMANKEVAKRFSAKFQNTAKESRNSAPKVKNKTLTICALVLVICGAFGFLAKQIIPSRSSQRPGVKRNSVHEEQTRSEAVYNEQARQLAALILLGMAAQMNANEIQQPQMGSRQNQHNGGGYFPEQQTGGGYFPGVGGADIGIQQKRQQQQGRIGLGRVKTCPICGGTGKRDVTGARVSSYTSYVMPCQNCRGTGAVDAGSAITPF